MAKIIVYTNKSGGTSICRPAPWARLVKSIKPKGSKDVVLIEPPQSLDRRAISVKEFAESDVKYAESEEKFLGRIRAISVPANATNVTYRDEADIPIDRTFRDALKPDLTLSVS